MNTGTDAQPAGTPQQPTWHVIRHSYFQDTTAAH
jgi:hypothetical protein